MHRLDMLASRASATGGMAGVTLKGSDDVDDDDDDCRSGRRHRHERQGSQLD